MGHPTGVAGDLAAGDDDGLEVVLPRQELRGSGGQVDEVLDRLIARTGVVPPLDEVTDAYVDLRPVGRTRRSGGGLGRAAHLLGLSRHALAPVPHPQHRAVA
jgi:hypothetical protein